MSGKSFKKALKGVIKYLKTPEAKKGIAETLKKSEIELKKTRERTRPDPEMLRTPMSI